ncbi:MAG: DNA topoisomerase IV subunit A [Rhizobiales bacterium]|nr:DNA topoisomerase IV subunit A [Hyphomicrobiales bacterium]
MGNELIPEGDVEYVNLRSALEERYLAYALATITHRALPDVRDGLKPVHRRLLFAMRQLKLDPKSSFKKSARVVGDVIGKYHPHGDQSVYDALVRLAQGFAVRYPLVDGQGNFGNIDGDSAAAMRYTEARMTEVANRLLEGLDEDAVDFRETYDGEESEPIVLPANFPNLLANGSTGIAVGMATSVPPHNVAELCDASLHLIKHPNASIEKLMDFVKGPDFPTGGIIVEDQASILNSYETGRGGFRVRARWHAETQARGAYVIVVTEIPYQVQKSKLIEKAADLLYAKRLPLLADIRDESAEDIRLVLEPKSRSVDPALLMESLFKLTDLENRISLNMNVLSQGRIPKVMNLREVLREWLEHRIDVLVRRTKFRVGKIEHRLEILAGYLIAFLNLDEVIRIIREEDHPKQDLMKAFSLTDVQAEAVLNMRLRSLRKLEEIELRQEHEKLTEEHKKLSELLASEDLQWSTVAKQVRSIKKTFGLDTELGKRRSTFGVAPEHNEQDIYQALIEKEPVTIVLSEKGWVRAMRGHLADAKGLTFKQDDALKLMFHAETTDKLLVASTSGKFYTLGADKLPGGRGHGEPVRIMFDMDADQDVLTIFTHQAGRKRLLAGTEGRGFIIKEDDMLANTRKGKQVLNVSPAHEMTLCPIAVGDQVAIIGQNRKLLLFPLDQLPEMGRGKGVRLQRYKDGSVSDIKVFSSEEGLTWYDTSGRQYNRSMTDLAEWVGERAQAGRMAPQGFPRTNKFSS